MKNLDLQIGRIVIEGLSPQEQRRFGTDLEAQLQKLAREGLLAQSAGKLRKTIANLNAGTLRPGATAAEAAAQVANSIVLHLNAPTMARPAAMSNTLARGEARKNA